MKNLILSNTKITNASICPRLFFFDNVLEIEPIEKPNYLESGDLYHRILEAHYKLKMSGSQNGPAELNKIIEDARNTSAREFKLEASEVEDTIKLYKEYRNHYMYEAWKPIAVEEPFIKQLYGDDDIRIYVEGKIDLVVETKDGHAIVDHKKTGYDSQPPDRDNQKLIYSWATGYRDFIINQSGTQKSKSIDDRFKRYYFGFQEHQIKEWEESTIDIAFDILDRMATKRYTARYTGCSRFGKKCAFYNVCNSPDELWSWKIQSEFKKKDHDLFPATELKETI